VNNLFKRSLLFVCIVCALFLTLESADAARQGAFGLAESGPASGLDQTASPPALVGRVIGTALAFVAIVFFILTVYAGILWMTAHGKAEQVKKAQSVLTGAAIGLIIVLSSYAITDFIFKSLESNGAGADVASQCNKEAPVEECEKVEGCSYYKDIISESALCQSDVIIDRCLAEQDACLNAEGGLEGDDCIVAFDGCINI
jgi:hypothetical protein